MAMRENDFGIAGPQRPAKEKPAGNRSGSRSEIQIFFSGRRTETAAADLRKNRTLNSRL